MTKREREIHDWLADEESREIFGEYRRFVGRTSHEDWASILIDKICGDLRDSRFVIYGMGVMGQKSLDCLKRMGLLENCAGIWDANPALRGRRIEGISITPPGQTSSAFDRILITSVNTSMVRQMSAVCENLDVEENTVSLYGFLERFLRRFRIAWTQKRNVGWRKYLDPDIIVPRLGADEIFVDGGSYDFGSSREFMDAVRKADGNVKKIYAFEASPGNTDLVKQGMTISGFGDAVLVPCAMWSETAELDFFVNCAHGYSSSVCNAENPEKMRISAVALDDVVPPNEKVTYIKFDVEGAELQAIIGARRTIEHWKPKCAISIYHKPNDFMEIPAYIKSLVPEYKAYMRHEQEDRCETVLYCVL
jgi:FkbM family methyltransferase